MTPAQHAAVRGHLVYLLRLRGIEVRPASSNRLAALWSKIAGFSGLCVGKTIYLSDTTYRFDENAWRTIAHEWVHATEMSGAWRMLGFLLRYSAPQILALLVLPALFFSFPAAVWLSLLALAAPWPAPWRVGAEARAYAVSVACGGWLAAHRAGGRRLPESPFEVAYYAEALTRPMYYFASWSEGWARRRIEAAYQELVTRTEKPVEGDGAHLAVWREVKTVLEAVTGKGGSWKN